MRDVRLVALLVLAACVPGVAHADSDGYYCAGRGYLAYQFGMAPKPIAPHRLYVISTRSRQGIPEPAVLELPQFQVHGMLCGDGWIDVASFTAVYRITLDQSDRPERYELRASLEGQPIPQEFITSQHQNLGAFSGGRAYLKPVRTVLGPKPLGGEYVLEVTANAIEPVARCEVSITSRIIETDRAGQEISQRIIFQGRGHRECGGGGEAQYWFGGPAPGRHGAKSLGVASKCNANGGVHDAAYCEGTTRQLIARLEAGPPPAYQVPAAHGGRWRRNGVWHRGWSRRVRNQDPAP